MGSGQQCHISCGLRHATTPLGTPGQAGRELQVGPGGWPEGKGRGLSGCSEHTLEPRGPGSPVTGAWGIRGQQTTVPARPVGGTPGPQAPGLAAAHQPPTPSSPVGPFSLTWGFLWQSPAGRAPETAIKCSPQLQARSAGSRCRRATWPRNLSGLLQLLGVPRRRLPQLG